MDVVYIVGTGSKWNNAELRYSLRSIAKCGIGLGRVFIVGYCPKFVNKKEVIHIPMDDLCQQRAKSVYLKIKAAIDDPRIPEEFLVSSDDHFFVRPTDFVNYPLHFKGQHMPRKEDIGNRKYGSPSYVETIVNTSNVMQAHGLGDRFFEGHTNKLYSKLVWAELEKMGVWSDGMQTDTGISTNSPMAAMYIQMHPDHTCVKRKDIKIRSFRNFEELQKSIGESNSFSIGDAAITAGIGKYLQSLFPYRCKFENAKS